MLCSRSSSRINAVRTSTTLRFNRSSSATVAGLELELVETELEAKFERINFNLRVSTILTLLSEYLAAGTACTDIIGAFEKKNKPQHRTINRTHKIPQEAAMRGEPLKVNIYINDRRLEEIPSGELAEIKQRLTEQAIDAAGYQRLADSNKRKN